MMTLNATFQLSRMCKKHLAYVVQHVIVHDIYQGEGERHIYIVEYGDLYFILK